MLAHHPLGNLLFTCVGFIMFEPHHIGHTQEKLPVTSVQTQFAGRALLDASSAMEPERPDGDYYIAPQG